MSEYYERYWTEDGFNPRTTTPPRLAAVFAQHVTPSSACLDLGCGDGGTSGVWLTEHAGSYVGVDISSTAVAAAQEKGLDARLIEDASTLPFEDATYDMAACVEVLEHLVAPQDALAELRRVMRPDGRLVVTVPNHAYWRNRLDLALFGRWNPRGDNLSAQKPWRDPHLRFFTRRSLTSLLEDTGWEVLSTGGHSEIGLLHTVPVARRLARRLDPGPITNALGAAAPTLMAIRLHAVATPAR